TRFSRDWSSDVCSSDLVFGALVFVSCIFLYAIAPKEPAPMEDEGFIFGIAFSDAPATLDYIERYTGQINGYVEEIDEISDVFLVNGGMGPGSGMAAIAGFIFEPWSERSSSTNQVLQQDLQPKLAELAGLNFFAQVPPSLPTAGGGGCGEFIIGGIGSPAQLSELAGAILERAQASRRFIFLDTDLKIDSPRIEVEVDRKSVV